MNLHHITPIQPARDILTAQVDLCMAISRLQVMKIGLHASVDELENNAAYIEQLCKLVSAHVEHVMADAASSQNARRIDETDARGIADLGSDLATELNKAAWALDGERV